MELGLPVKMFATPRPISQIAAADYILNFWDWGWGVIIGWWFKQWACFFDIFLSWFKTHAQDSSWVLFNI